MVKKRSRVTLQQVAEHAGVSRATASKVVRGSSNVSDAAREKVFNSMKELGYIYDRVAANLRSNRSNTIGLIITDIRNPYFSDLLIGIHESLDKEGYTVILGTTFDSVEKQDLLLSTMLEHRVGGILLSPVPGSSPETVERLSQFDIPIVLAARRITTDHQFDYVGIDNVEGAKLAVQHLVAKGHQRIAFIGGPSNSSAWQERTEGYCLALLEAGIPVDEALIKEGPTTRQGGYETIRKVLEQPDPPTAIFCYNDIIALGALTYLDEIGIKPGQHISIVGFDDIQEASMTPPGLSTIAAHPQQIGAYAANLLHQRISGLAGPPQQIILSPDLIVRGTT
ncbi:LacI family DNA-binding transcriptional regulator [Brevibacillus fulvus]|uniref:LacI family transcriptional regulator n=1 Tax=Brevibacillus fulvus TaxID=1125967 RepID=A0A938XVQ6_9BACL|nr:LacI family DNA-binding transcriptional regulator [Brevibacillus fulvus]MBM7591353.1 LacI family transcriptional regulator [Brevibacillus fulvus]